MNAPLFDPLLASALLGGLLLGLGLAGWVRRGPTPPSPLPATEPLEDLIIRRDVLVAQLRDLDAARQSQAGTGRDEQAALELECARTLRDIDQLRATLGPAARARGAQRGSRAGALRQGLVWGAGTAIVVVGLTLAVSRSTTPRPTAPQGAPEPQGDELAQLEQRVKGDPENLDARLDLARLQLMRHDLMAVFDNTRFVLERSPGQPRALSYQALVRFAMGEPDRALAMLKEAVGKDPKLLDGWVHLIFVYAQLGQLAEAERAVAQGSAAIPTEAAQLQHLLAELRSQSKAAQAEPATATPQRPAGGVAGVLELGGSAGVPPARGVVFLILRPSGVTQGAPLAVRRLPGDSFPLPFEIGPADSMMGQALPERVRVEARLDPDGDPSTHEPDAPHAVADEVRLGTTRLRLLLQ